MPTCRTRRGKRRRPRQHLEQSGETELADRAEPATQTPQTAVAGPSSTSSPTVGDFLGIVFDFLAQLIATFDVAEPASTDAAAAQTEATVPLGFSLKLRIFNSIMLSFSEAAPETGAEADPAGSDAANQAAPLLTETVDAMAAGTEPSHEAVA